MENLNCESLMIGDWVYNTHNRQPEQVTEIREKMVMLAYNDLYDYDEIEPIPLTVGLLEDNGFVKTLFHECKRQHQWIWSPDNLLSVSLWCREPNDNAMNGWTIRIEHPLVSLTHKVVYVHQMQHAFRQCGIDKEITFDQK